MDVLAWCVIGWRITYTGVYSSVILRYITVILILLSFIDTPESFLDTSRSFSHVIEHCTLESSAKHSVNH